MDNIKQKKPDRCIDPVIKYCQGCKYGWVKYPEWVETSEDLADVTFESGCMFGLENTEPTQAELDEFEKMYNGNVPHETIEPYYICWNNHGHDESRRIYSDDDTGTIFLEVITPACNNYSPFEGTCISECTWCDNPYHCKYKNVSRETFYNNFDLWHYANFCQAMIVCPMCCAECSTTTRTRCIMYDIAMNKIIGGEY